MLIARAAAKALQDSPMRFAARIHQVHVLKRTQTDTKQAPLGSMLALKALINGSFYFHSREKT